MTLLRELELPVFTVEQRVEFAIKCAMKVYQEPGFVKWAKGWLTGKDRSAEAASAAVVWAASAATWAAGAAGAAGAAEASFRDFRAAQAADWAAEAGFRDFQPIIEELKC
jgi:hypothetical protein